MAFCADDDGDETLESCAAADAALCSGKTLTPGDSDSCEVTGGGACTWSAAQVESCVATDLDACAAVAAAVPNGDASLCLSASSVASQARLAVGEAVCVYTPGTTSCVGCEKRHFLSTFYIKMIILPRQARDKHRESTQKSAVLCRTSPSATGCICNHAAVDCAAALVPGNAAACISAYGGACAYTPDSLATSANEESCEPINTGACTVSVFDHGAQPQPQPHPHLH